MSLTDDFLRGLQKKNATTYSGGSNKLTKDFVNGVQKKKKKDEDDIAPVIITDDGIAPTFDSPAAEVGAFLGQSIGQSLQKKADEESFFDGWFKKGNKDVSKAILGTLSDLGEDLTTGIVGLGEKIVDAGAWLAPIVSKSQYYQNGGGYNLEADRLFEEQNQAAKEEMSKFIAKDLYDEGKVAKQILSNLYAFQEMTNIAQNGGMFTQEDLDRFNKNRGSAYNYMVTDMEKDSVLDEKSDSLVQSAGQLGATAALSAVGVPWYLITGASTFGSEAENALNQGATFEEAGLSATISAGAEILTEKISGGIKFGGKTLDDGLTKLLSRNISNRAVRTAAKLGIDMAGEGGEEVLSGLMSAIGQKLTYAEEKELEELFSKEDAWESFIGGAVLGGVGSATQAAKGKITGVDSVTELTKNEQAVVDKLYEDALADEAKNGKVTQKQKAEIYDDILYKLEKGYIDTDIIEEVLGGDSYNTYKETLDNENALTEQEKKLNDEFKTLNKMVWQEMTGEQHDRREELRGQLEELRAKIADTQSNSQKDLLKAQLTKDVYEMSKGDRLVESFFEQVRSKQKYEADLTKYEGRARDVIQKVMESGLADNTNQTHEFWDWAAKMASDLDTDITLAENEQLLEIVKAEYAANGKEFDESQFEGQTIDGYASKNGIVLNAASKRALNFIVGHEVTHKLEKSKHYGKLQKLLFEYAKDEYESRFNKRSGQYSNKFKADDTYKSNVDKEVTSDLVGDYLFTDKGFIDHLTKDRNVFQRVWDEVKYMAKIATAGSEQAKQLERVKREFERAYREANKKAQSGTQFSVSDQSGYAPTFYSNMAKVVDGVKQEKLGASSVVNMLRGKGVKAEEIKWSGIESFLEGKKSVTKAELQEFVNGSMLQIEEQMRGKPQYTEKEHKNLEQAETDLFNLIDKVADCWQIIYGTEMPLEVVATDGTLYGAIKRAIRNARTRSDISEIMEDADRFEEHKKAIQELNRTLTSIREVEEIRDEIVSKATDRNETKWYEYRLAGGENYRELVFKIPGAIYSNMAMQAHWGADAQGVLAHARMQDFDTADGKMLFIEEIQSDWHNQGHKEGYRKEGEKTESILRAESQEAYKEFYNAVEKMLEDNANWEDDNAIYYAHPVAVAEMFEGNESYFDQYRFTDEQRETIRSMVAEETARQEALKTAPKQEMATDAPFKETYHEYVLKRLIRMAAEEGYDSIGWTTADLQMERWNPHRQTNEMMSIPAKNPNAVAFEDGYRIEYDQDMPKFLKKYGKQWGATVGKTDIQTKQLNQKQEADLLFMADILEEGDSYIRHEKGIKEVWSMDITPAMKQSVLHEGQPQFSVSDSDGKQLTKEQQEYFKDSKMRDENGNLKVMYHGSQDAGFHVFNSKFSDDDTSFFFVDRNDVAASYSGTYETYEAKAFKTAEDANKFFESIGKPEYEVIEKDGKYRLREDEGSSYYTVAESESLEEIYQEFCDYEGVGYGDANYKVYLNLKNPLVVDAEGRNWDNVTREFSQEIADKYKSLTEEEKATLHDLAGWGDIREFRHELNKALDIVESRGGGDGYTRRLASAYQKLGEDINMYDLFSIAEDNFSDLAIEAWAVKQMNTRDYAQKAKAEGYDGVIFKNIHDNGGYSNGSEGASTVAIAFNSNQIKSTANAQPTTDPDIRYSVSEAENQEGLNREQEVVYSISYDSTYMDNAIKRNEANKGKYTYYVDSKRMEEAKVLREKVAARMNDIKDRGLVGLPEDMEGNTYIANSSYDGTEENTTICPRSLAAEAFVDAVSEYLGRPLTVKEQIYISQDLQGRSLTPECTYCYVATDRKAYRAFLGEYINQRDSVLQKLSDNPNSDVSRSGELYKEFLNGRKDTNPMYNRFKMWVDAYQNGTPMVDASHLANINRLMGDIKSEFGEALKPQIVDAMKYAQSASWAKKRINYVAYNGHILNWKQDRINKLNSHYGLRMYSFSDFHPAFVLENMQMITDASVRGLKMLGYTKDTDFVDIFAPSGMNINVSTFGFESGGNVYENNLIGAEWEKAKALRAQYPNVGVTFVATNDTLVNWALEQDWIDVVIPYHLVRTGAEVAEAFKYTNYTSESADTKTKDWVKGDKKFIAPTEHNNDLATYLAALEKNHLKPRFERFIDNPNYMKLVNECRQPASMSKPVQPAFNEEAAMKALAKLEANGYYQPIGGSVDRMYEIAAEVAEDMTNQLAPAMSVSDIGEQHKQYGRYNVYAKDMLLNKGIAPVAENAAGETISKTESVPVVGAENETTTEELFPDNLAPVQSELEQLMAEEADMRSVLEGYAGVGDIDAVNRLLPEYEEIRDRIRELEADENQRADSLTDEDAPPVKEAPYYGNSKRVMPRNPFADREWDDVVGTKNRSVKAYMYEHPEVKPFFQEEAMKLLGELNDTTRGERFFNDQVYYESGGEKGITGVKRHTSESMETLLDDWGMSYAEIEKGLKAIIEDNGAENITAAKKIEFMLNNRLLNGYKNFYGKGYIEANQDYIDTLEEMEINSYSKEAFDSFMATADQYAPMKPTETVNTDSQKGVINGQQTYITTEDKLNGRQAQTGIADAPIYDSKEKDTVKGQQTMFEPPKPNPKVASVLTEESAIQKEKSGIGGKLVSALVDKGMVFENLSLETGNHEVQAKYNYALPSNTEARAQYFMEHGAKGVKPLKDIKNTVDKSGKTEQFYDYLYHVHNIDRMTLEDRFDDTPNKTVFGETITADVSRKKVARYEKANPEFKNWANDVYAFNKHLRNLLVENGIISQETADLWEKMYPHYVPIRRVDTQGQNISVPLDSRKTGVNNPVKRAVGGSSDIMPLFETMAQRAEQTYRAIARNSFGIELKNTLGTTIEAQQDATGVDEMIDTIEAQEDHLLKPGSWNSKPTFTVFENGERVEFEITEDMYNALKPADGLLGHRSKAIGKVGDMRRNLLTVWNPVFALYRNPIKDMQDVAVNSQHAVKTYLNVPNAIIQMAAGGKYAEEYHQNGGKSNTYFDSRTNKFKAEDNLFKKAIGLPVRAIETAGEFIEEIPRLAEYIASRKNGRSVERSMLDAARVTTNFAAGGDFTKFLNSHGFTFLNASVQGASQHMRNFREAKQEGLKGYVKVLAKYTIAGLPTILLNGLLWDDDEEYEELSDYVKQNYYVVAKTQDGKFVRIPKGRTAAVMGELMQQMDNLRTGNDEADFSTFFELFMNNIAPSNPIENNILAPIIQTASNKAWYGGDLVPSRLQDLPAEEQFDESTDSISKWLGEKTGFSPYKINYLLDQYSGGLGDVFLPMLTPEAESGDDTTLGNFLAPWKKEVTTDMVLNNKNPGDFYDLRDELEVTANGKNATEEDKMKSLYMDSVSWEMGDLYAQKREIQSGDLPDDEKYEAVRGVQEKINELAKTAMQGYNDVTIEGLYSEVGNKRYNMDAESGKWYEIKAKNADGSPNYYYQKEQTVTKALGISYAEYWNNREEYNYAYDKPEQYALAQAVGGYQSYRGFTSELWDIKADKDKNGKSISGSRKRKVVEYLNNLDADYYTKIILFKNEYNADNTYNYEIVEYLNSRQDISYKQMEAILKYLGFDVDAQGNISW